MYFKFFQEVKWLRVMLSVFIYIVYLYHRNPRADRAGQLLAALEFVFMTGPAFADDVKVGIMTTSGSPYFLCEPALYNSNVLLIHIRHNPHNIPASRAVKKYIRYVVWYKTYADRLLFR